MKFSAFEKVDFNRLRLDLLCNSASSSLRRRQNVGTPQTLCTLIQWLLSLYLMGAACAYTEK